jgi:hypothetical protein
MQEYSLEVSVHRSPLQDDMLLQNTICFYTKRMIHDTELFKKGLELLLKIDQELESGRPPIEFDKI